MKTIVFAIMLFMFSSLGASTLNLNSDELSENYSNSNFEISKNYEKIKFRVAMANSLKQINSEYQKNASILSKVVLVLNYKF